MGREQWGMTIKGVWGILLGWLKCCRSREKWCLHDIMNVLKPTGLFTFKWLLICLWSYLHKGKMNKECTIVTEICQRLKKAFLPPYSMLNKSMLFLKITVGKKKKNFPHVYYLYLFLWKTYSFSVNIFYKFDF